jgi:hypothetical protein
LTAKACTRCGAFFETVGPLCEDCQERADVVAIHQGGERHHVVLAFQTLLVAIAAIGGSFLFWPMGFAAVAGLVMVVRQARPLLDPKEREARGRLLPAVLLLLIVSTALNAFNLLVMGAIVFGAH